MVEGDTEPLRDAVGFAELVTESVTLGEAEGAADAEGTAVTVRMPVAAPVVDGETEPLRDEVGDGVEEAALERDVVPEGLCEARADAVSEGVAEAVAQAVPAGPHGPHSEYAYQLPLAVEPKADLK